MINRPKSPIKKDGEIQTPPSTHLEEIADLFPKTSYKNKRQLADKERFKLNAALNDYLFNNCDHEHDGYPNHLACRWCVLEVIAAIVERCLAGGGEDQKSTPTGLRSSPR